MRMSPMMGNESIQAKVAQLRCCVTVLSVTAEPCAKAMQPGALVSMVVLWQLVHRRVSPTGMTAASGEHVRVSREYASLLRMC